MDGTFEEDTSYLDTVCGKQGITIKEFRPPAKNLEGNNFWSTGF
jgi:hypothetical protein